MRNTLKKLMTVFTAGTLAVTAAASLAGCGGKFKPLSGIPSGTATSNGGFVVEVQDYIYFINGVESYTADNTYGDPVKGALMRVKKSELSSGASGEIVVPSLMAAGDYEAGIYIYGDRVYYATPNNIENTVGEIEQNYLDFKSAKLDGSSVESYFNVSDNAANYRFVQVDGTVYVLYTQSETLHSYNTAKKQDTVLAKGVSDVIFSENKEDPYAYYTMGVTMDADMPNGSHDRDYNQLFRVRADVTECPYAEIRDYAWNEDYLEENDEEPYLNFGTLLLDGIGSIYQENPTIFSHDLAGSTPLSAAGFTYTVQSVTDDGIYFTRADLATTGSVGEAAWLYFLPADKLETGNSVTRNSDETLDIVAQPTDTEKANDEAIYYVENGEHHYLYTADSNIYRVDVNEAGEANVVRIAQGIGTATLVCIDDSDPTYRYLYYTTSGNAGNYVFRVVYNGSEENYKTLNYDANKPYRPTQVLRIEHARSWYDIEVLDGRLFFADAETIGSSSYNYVAYVDLKNASGALMNNSELSDYNDRLDETLGDEGYLAELTDEDRTALSTAIKYYFYTGKTDLFYENIEEAKTESGESDYELYHQEDIADFEAYTKSGKDLRSMFIHEIGSKSENDIDAIDSYWKTTLEHYTAPSSEEETSGGLPAWAGALIGIAIGVVVLGVAVGVYLVMRSRKSEEEEKEEKMFVDTTDDKSVDVYADQPEPQPEEAPAEEPEEPEEPETEEAETPEEEAGSEDETPQEPDQAPETAENAAEEPAESASEQSDNAPAETNEEKPEETSEEKPQE